MYSLGVIVDAPKIQTGKRGRLFTGINRSAFKHSYDRIQRLPGSKQSRSRVEVDSE